MIFASPIKKVYILIKCAHTSLSEKFIFLKSCVLCVWNTLLNFILINSYDDPLFNQRIKRDIFPIIRISIRLRAARTLFRRLLCRSCMFPRESNDFRATDFCGSSLTSSYYMLRSYFREARESYSHTRNGTRHHPVLQWDLSTLETLTWRLARAVSLSFFNPLSLYTVDVIKNTLPCNREYTFGLV